MRRAINGPDQPGVVVRARSATASKEQDLEIYWTDQAIRSMETWGLGNAWDEIQYLTANLEGKVLDIACGTGKVSELLSKFPQLDMHGLDISDVLIQKAHERGLPKEKYIVCDATKLPYSNDQFDYSYSIGSLEHFTEQGIVDFVREAHRVTRKASFHQMPTSRSGQDEGWLTTMQSFHNNSVAWWRKWFEPVFREVHVLDSRWEDSLSVGKWFVLKK
jgi:ubiquinone/menaquinone biosynthesis C-methylase UbiE